MRFVDARQRTGYAEVRNKAGDLITGYQYDDFAFHPYCHPVSLSNGKSLTLTAPADHPWHNGVAFAWKYLNGYNVWDFEATGPKPGKVRHEEIRFCGDRPALTHTLLWMDGKGTPLIRDVRTLEVGLDGKGYPVLDWHFHFTALAEEVVCDRHVEWGGYGGFYIRFARGTDFQLLNAEGRTNWEEEERLCSRWCAFSFAMDGLPSRKFYEHHFGAAVFDHPDNPRHPTPWLTFNRLNMQKIMPAFIRDEPYVFQKGGTLELRYRVLSFAGKPDPRALETAWSEWSRPGHD
jgi:hypothetical protein